MLCYLMNNKLRLGKLKDKLNLVMRRLVRNIRRSKLYIINYFNHCKWEFIIIILFDYIAEMTKF
jgi:hypothetical protein